MFRLRPYYTFVIVLLLASSLRAVEVPALMGPVNDLANVLTSAEEKVLSDKLLAQEKATSNQIVILTVPNLDGETVAQFGIRVAEAWKIGQKGKDNGVIIIQSVAERKIRIETGRGVEEHLPDALCKRIIDREMVPHFKKKDFAGGYNAAVEAIDKAIKGQFIAAAVPAVGGEWNVPTWLFILLILLGVIAVIVFLTWICDHEDFGSSSGGFSGFSSSGSSSGGGSSGGGYSGGGGSFGGGGSSGSY